MPMVSGIVDSRYNNLLIVPENRMFRIVPIVPFLLSLFSGTGSPLYWTSS